MFCETGASNVTPGYPHPSERPSTEPSREANTAGATGSHCQSSSRTIGCMESPKWWELDASWNGELFYGGCAVLLMTCKGWRFIPQAMADEC